MANEDRKILLDLAAIEEARGPQPDDYFFPLTKREAAAVSYATAYVLANVACDIEECPNCNRFRRLFWDCASWLGPATQKDLFDFLLRAGIAIPEGPWEEVGE